MKPYTEEELSRILGEHAAGQLRMGGVTRWEWAEDVAAGCANQVAYNEPETDAAYDANPAAARRFDGDYDTRMPAEDLLELLEDEPW